MPLQRYRKMNKKCSEAISFKQRKTTPSRLPATTLGGSWPNLCNNIQVAVDYSHPKGMYEGIKTATSLTGVKTASLKSKTGEFNTDQNKQL